MKVGGTAVLRCTIWGIIAAAASLLIACAYASWSLRPPRIGGDGSGAALPLTERAGLWVIYGLGQSAPLLPWAALSTLLGLLLVRAWFRATSIDGSPLRANRWDHLQLELCIVSAVMVLMSVAALAAAVLGALNSNWPLPAEQAYGACAIVGGYSLVSLCLGSLFFAAWWSADAEITV